MNTENETKFIFDLIEDPHEQIKRLKLLIQNEKLEDFVYVDLRIEGKIFFCPKKDENDWDNTEKCENNLNQIYNYKF